MPYKKKISAIYTITNTKNGKIYIGYSNDFFERKSQHLSALRLHQHDNSYIQNVFNKYGEEIIVIDILEECPEQLLCALEHYWVTILKTCDRKWGYNLKKTHPYNKTNGFKGKKHSLKTRKKMRLNKLGKKKVFSHQALKKNIERNKEMFSKSVLMEKEGESVKFDSIKDCSDFLGVTPTSVGGCLHGRQKTVKGYTIKLL